MRDFEVSKNANASIRPFIQRFAQHLSAFSVVNFRIRFEIHWKRRMRALPRKSVCV